VRLTINTFDSLTPIGQSSGVLCISHPRAFPRHLSLAPLPSPVFQVPVTELTTPFIPSLTHFFLEFLCYSPVNVCPSATSQNCTVSHDRVLCLVGLGLKTKLPRTGYSAPILHPPRLRHGTIFLRLRTCFRSTENTSLHQPRLKTRPLWFHSTLIVGFINGIYHRLLVA
jgi:hypothetical protein